MTTRCMFYSTDLDTFDSEIDPIAEEAEELVEFKVSNAMKLVFNRKIDDFSFWLSLYDSYHYSARRLP